MLRFVDVCEWNPTASFRPRNKYPPDAESLQNRVMFMTCMSEKKKMRWYSNTHQTNLLPKFQTAQQKIKGRPRETDRQTGSQDRRPANTSYPGKKKKKNKRKTMLQTNRARNRRLLLKKYNTGLSLLAKRISQDIKKSNYLVCSPRPSMRIPV